MTGLAEVLTRLTNDPAFADEIRRDPVAALLPFELDLSELGRLERVMEASLRRSNQQYLADDGRAPSAHG